MVVESRLQGGGESAVLPLIIPSPNPFIGAKRVVGTLELLAGREVLALCRYALEVIGVVLVAVPCLIGVREPGIKPSRLKDVFALEVGLRHDGRWKGGVVARLKASSELVGWTIM